MNLSLVGISCNQLEIKIQNFAAAMGPRFDQKHGLPFLSCLKENILYFRDPSLICSNFINHNDNMFSLETVVEQIFPIARREKGQILDK